MNDDELVNRVMRFDTEAYAIAQTRMKSAPCDLTEREFAQLAIISTRQEEEAREARRLAQLAIVEACKTVELKTKSAAVIAPVEDMTTFITKHGKQPASWAALDEIADLLIAVKKSHIDPLTDRTHALEARVLELEAQAAASAPVSHAEN